MCGWGANTSFCRSFSQSVEKIPSFEAPSGSLGHPVLSGRSAGGTDPAGADKKLLAAEAEV